MFKRKQPTRAEAQKLALEALKQMELYKQTGLECLRLAVGAEDTSRRLATLLCLVVARSGGEIRLPDVQITQLPERHLLQERFDEEADEVVLTSALAPDVAEEDSLVVVKKPLIEVVKA